MKAGAILRTHRPPVLNVLSRMRQVTPLNFRPPDVFLLGMGDQRPQLSRIGEIRPRSSRAPKLFLSSALSRRPLRVIFLPTAYQVILVSPADLCGRSSLMLVNVLGTLMDFPAFTRS